MGRLPFARLARRAPAAMACVAVTLSAACASVLGLDLQYQGGDAGAGTGGTDDSAVPPALDGDLEGDAALPESDGAAALDAGDSGGMALIVRATNPQAIAVDDTRLYWVDQDSTTGGSIRSIGKYGTGQPVTLATGQIAPGDIAVDATNVYWSVGEAPTTVDGGGSCLARMVNKAGGATPACIATGPQATLRMAMSAANILYLVSGVPDPLLGYSTKAAGSPFMSLKTQGAALAVAGTSTTLFVGNGNGNHIDTALLPGPTMGKILCTSCGGASILDMVVDPSAEKLLWVTQTGGVFTEAVAGAMPAAGTLLGTLPSAPRRMARDASFVYVTSEVGAVYAVPSHAADAGGSVITLASGQNAPFGVAVDAARVYWSSADGAIRAVPLP